MASYSFPSADNTVPRFSQWTAGPQQRIYERPLWDTVPLPLFALGASSGLINDGGVLVVAPGQGWPTSGTGLPIGGLFTNGADGGPATVVMPTSPPASSSDLYFGSITASELLIVGGSNIRTTPPLPGSLIIWNAWGELWVA